MVKLFTSWAELPRWFWPVLIGLNFLLHAPFFNLPPIGPHTWRQCNTMAVARNFCEEDMNILRPRIDRRNDSDGVTGMQFPSYEWVVALSYKAMGFHEILPRISNWLISLAGLFFCYQLIRYITKSVWMGAVAAWSLAWSPEIFYHSINALPDILALSASLGGLWCFLRWYRKRQVAYFWASLALTTLAGLTKLQYLIIGFPIAALLVEDILHKRFLWRRDLVPLGFFSVAAVVVPLGWYAYAKYLIAASGLEDFGLELRPAESIAAGLDILWRNIKFDWSEVLLGYGTAVLVGLGAWQVWQRSVSKHPWFWPVATWAVAVVAYYLIELTQMRDHVYYMLPLLPLLLLLAAAGSEWLRQRVRWHWLLLLLLIVQPVWAGLRIIPYWVEGPRDVPQEVYYPATRNVLEQAVPNDALCIVGPDISGCKQFYFLHKRGFGLNSPEQLDCPMPDGKTYVANCVARGARYLYLSDSTLLTHPRLAPYLGRRVARVGGIYVLELKPAAK